MSRHRDHNESRNWRREKCGLQKDPSREGNCNEVLTYQDDFSYSMDERTPIKDCIELANHAYDKNIDYSGEVPKESTAGSLRTKRRRMLQFDTEARDSLLHCEEISNKFLTNMSADYCQVNEDPVSEDLREASHWVAGCSEGMSVSNGDGVNPISGGWQEQFVDDMEMNFDTDVMEMNFDTDNIIIPSISDITIDMSEFSNPESEHDANGAPELVKQTSSNVIFKDIGTKSYLLTSYKTASSVAYPFDFVKPSKLHGDVTLMDINQLICTPPPLKSKHCNGEDSALYPISAITGKPVVKQTKIRTEGGKGCITIMRTKG